MLERHLLVKFLYYPRREKRIKCLIFIDVKTDLHFYSNFTQKKQHNS